MEEPNLAAVLRAVLSDDPEKCKVADDILNQLQSLPHYLIRLLHIAMDESCEMDVREVASICFKRFLVSNWMSDCSDESQKVSETEKAIVRETILGYISEVPPLLRTQFEESIRTIVCSDYPGQWSCLLPWITHNLDLNKLPYDALYVLRVLVKKYQFNLGDGRAPFYHIVKETFPCLLDIFSKVVQVSNPPFEVVDLIRLMCKIFWSSIYVEIPELLFDQDIFNRWMILFMSMLQRPVPVEEEPMDTNIKKSRGWWKVKKWTIRIMNHLYSIDDLKPRKPGNEVVACMFQKQYARKVLAGQIEVLKAISIGGYIPDGVVNAILQYLTKSVAEDNTYFMMLSHIDSILVEIIFPLMCFHDGDLKLWNEDPCEYVRRAHDVNKGFYNPRTAAMDFMSELVGKRGSHILPKLIDFVLRIFRRYDDASDESKQYHEKDGALLAVGILSDKLKQTDPYKLLLEQMLVCHVVPEFSSHVGHLRAKAAWVAGQYADIMDSFNFYRAMHSVAAGINDSDLPVRVASLFALRSFVNACKDMEDIQSILPQLLDELLKLLNDAVYEDIGIILGIMVDKFSEEMAPYAIGLCQNLAPAFWSFVASSGAHADSISVESLQALTRIFEVIGNVPHRSIQGPSLLSLIHKNLSYVSQDSVENSGYIGWDDNYQAPYVSWVDYIPTASAMYKPKDNCHGTCIGHSYAECLTSRRRLLAAKNGKPVYALPDISILHLVDELIAAKCITDAGGKATQVSEYLLEHGAPLVGSTARAQIDSYNIYSLVNLQDISVFDLPDELNTLQFTKSVHMIIHLLLEIQLNGPVVGLFNATHDWPYANGEVYYDCCGHGISRSNEPGLDYVNPHAALVYGFENTKNDPFGVELLVQDNMGPHAHTNGRAHMNISSLRGYIAPDIMEEYLYVNESRSLQKNSMTRIVTEQGETAGIHYAASFMQGWCEFVQDDHEVFLDVEDSTSFFGVYKRTKACVVLTRGSKIVTKSMGDSCAVLSRNGQAISLTCMERISGDENLNSIEMFGYISLKECIKNAGKQCILRSDLDIRIENITDYTEFLVVASDGIWNHMPTQSVIDFINQLLKLGETDLGRICERLITYCNGEDNMTVMLIQFKKPGLIVS